MIGPVLGAMALHWFGTAGCFYANAVSFLAVIFAVSRVDNPNHPNTPAPIPKSMLHSLLEGLRHMRRIAGRSCGSFCCWPRRAFWAFRW